ncbi:MAG: MATE family efflux transporter [Bryobacteraceae bacterium]
MPSQSSPVKSGIWASIREALAGSQQDFTEGSLGRGITLLAIPMVLEMAMESLFAVVDVFFVARLGADAVVAVGLTETMLTLVFAIALGVGMATTAMVARRIGEHDPEGAAVAAVQSIVLGILVSVVTGAIAILYGPQLLVLMGASPSVVRNGSGYTRVLLGANATVILIFLINAIFRGAGDAAIAMRVLWLANIINIVLDPCLIFGLGPFPEMGVTGAAVATTIGRGAGVIYQIWMLSRSDGRVIIRRSQIRLDLPVMLRLLRVSLTGVLQFLIAHASWIAMVRIVAIFGSAGVAGYTIAIRIIIFGILPSWGLSNAAATLVGQNLGAGKPERAERAVWLTGLYNVIFLGSMGLVFIVFAEPIVRIFTQDPELVPSAVNCLRVVSYGNLFYAYGMVMVQAFNGAGDTVTPSIVNFFCYWLFQIPVAYFLGVTLNLGPEGVFWAIPTAEFAIALVGVLIFRRGAWKKQKI